MTQWRVLSQQPNFYGNPEDGRACAEAVHERGRKLIMGCNPIALAIVETHLGMQGRCGGGEGEPLGLPLSFGGPYLGFMAASRDMGCVNCRARIVGKQWIPGEQRLCAHASRQGSSTSAGKSRQQYLFQ